MSDEKYKFIKIRGLEGAYTGYFVPRMYQLTFNWPVVKTFKWWYLKEVLNGWTVWFVESGEDYERAIKTLDKLKKTRIFEYKVWK